MGERDYIEIRVKPVMTWTDEELNEAIAAVKRQWSVPSMSLDATPALLMELLMEVYRLRLVLRMREAGGDE